MGHLRAHDRPGDAATPSVRLMTARTSLIPADVRNAFAAQLPGPDGSWARYNAL
ncbi:hypothetical protein P8605_23290 [Streptomyces sp. T-3]|nr:hypothetical protein [Streptomyces sp. T-3]